MPDDEPGYYQAGSCEATPEFGFERRHKRYPRVFKSQRSAYKYARWRTLFRAAIVPLHYGVIWYVVDITDEVKAERIRKTFSSEHIEDARKYIQKQKENQ